MQYLKVELEARELLAVDRDVKAGADDPAYRKYATTLRENTVVFCNRVAGKPHCETHLSYFEFDGWAFS